MAICPLVTRPFAAVFCLPLEGNHVPRVPVSGNMQENDRENAESQDN